MAKNVYILRDHLWVSPVLRGNNYASVSRVSRLDVADESAGLKTTNEEAQTFLGALKKKGFVPPTIR